MTLTLILNLVFAALVLIVIPGMLMWAIRTSRNENPPRRLARRPSPRPVFPSPRVTGAYRRREPA